MPVMSFFVATGFPELAAERPTSFLYELNVDVERYVAEIAALNPAVLNSGTLNLLPATFVHVDAPFSFD